MQNGSIVELALTLRIYVYLNIGSAPLSRAAYWIVPAGLLPRRNILYKDSSITIFRDALVR